MQRNSAADTISALGTQLAFTEYLQQRLDVGAPSDYALDGHEVTDGISFHLTDGTHVAFGLRDKADLAAVHNTHTHTFTHTFMHNHTHAHMHAQPHSVANTRTHAC